MAKAAKKPAKTEKAAAKKSPAKKSPAKKATTKKPAAKKVAPKKAATKTSPKKAQASKRSGSKPPVKKTPVKPAFDKKFLDEMRKSLIEERSRYVHSAETLKAEADAMVESREPGDVQFDEESGEGDTLAVERERDLALSAQARAAVDEIDAALARLDDGTYGICVGSGKPIPKERLRAIPWATERVEYKAGGFGLR
jgi:RNA polymerase-binding transcription factor DksA